MLCLAGFVIVYNTCSTLSLLRYLAGAATTALVGLEMMVTMMIMIMSSGNAMLTARFEMIVSGMELQQNEMSEARPVGAGSRETQNAMANEQEMIGTPARR